ncbi:MAG: DNA polymerase domain-containing protein [Terriglobia bacterium]
MTQSLVFSQNQTLFGWESTEGIVALELEGESAIRLYRKVDGKVISELQAFRPFLWLESADLLDEFPGEVEFQALGGNLRYRTLALFQSWKEVNAAKKRLNKITGFSPSDRSAPYFFFADPIHQHLLLSGQTCFKGIQLADLKRLQLDIETYCTPGFEFCSPQREEDRIIAIALSDNFGWETVLWGKDLSEAEMLTQLTHLIRERDPDIIEGHNIFKFDLNYIQERAKRHNLVLGWGRDGSEATSYDSRLQIAERTIDYPKWQVHGRHIVDTWILSQYYDIGGRELESLSLKEMAKHFGLARQDRAYVEGADISRTFDEDPELLYRYALDDVRETRGLSELLLPSYFIQAQIFPYNFQDVIVRGNATKINALFVREYLRSRHSLPSPPAGSQDFAGGYTDIFYEGVVNHVAHCDVTSLYPSIMISQQIKPAPDELNVFLPLLTDLRNFRIEAKKLAQRAKSQEEKIHFQALQTAFKILINSFYGYLGTSFSNFADFQAAGKVTEWGQTILRQMIDWLRERGCQIIELDTDGIYFVLPEGSSSSEKAETLIHSMSGILPEGIEVEFDGHYQAMFSYKMKNYALLGDDGRLTIKGSGLRSRGVERFLRNFLRELILYLLKGEHDQILPLYESVRSRIEGHQLDISEFCKTETLSETLVSYQQKIREKKRNPTALYELALKSGRDYQPGDQLSYYVTGTRKNVRVYDNCKLSSQWNPAQPDENVVYYKEKLSELFEKFQPYAKTSQNLGQQSLEL